MSALGSSSELVDQDQARASRAALIEYLERVAAPGAAPTWAPNAHGPRRLPVGRCELDDDDRLEKVRRIRRAIAAMGAEGRRDD